MSSFASPHPSSHPKTIPNVYIQYAASVGASAFGGLLAFGVFHITSGSLYSWSYLFILEGCLTVLIAFIALLVLPKSPRAAYFLSEAEKNVAEKRILLDSVESLENHFNWTEALSEFKAPHIYIRIVLMFNAGVLVGSNGNFLAIITARLGYSVVKTNLVISNRTCLEESKSRANIGSSTLLHRLLWLR